MARRRLASICLALALPALAAAAASEVERLDIVDRSIEHHGGELYASSETRVTMCSKSGCYRLRARVDGEWFDLEAAGLVSAGERRVRVTNDTVEWWENGEPTPVAEREQALRDWVMARIYFTFLPFRLNDPGVYKQDLGLESWGGRSLHKVKVSFAPGSSTHARDEYLYWLDPVSGRLEQFAYSYASGGGGLRFRQAFDHRRVGGVLFFDQANLGVDGPGLSVDQITPDYVDSAMSPVSMIRLTQIEVEPLR